MKSKYDHIIKIITIIISYSNSFANPLLYIFLSNKFTPFQNLKQRIDSFRKTPRNSVRIKKHFNNNNKDPIIIQSTLV